MSLEFEKPILELETKISELKHLSESGDVNLKDEITKLENKLTKLILDCYSKLGAWEKTQLSRHPSRPYTLDYLPHICTNFMELHGDRTFADDPAIVGGIGRIGRRPVMILGHQKGRSTKEKVKRNFGMPRPEGYRKAKRLMNMAQRFDMPLITFIDTPGAYPGIGAEERGQSLAIAESIETMTQLNVPIISVVIGEGGSGGALAIGVSDKILMMQYSIYSVISPESCSSILWKGPEKAQEAAKSLKLTAKDVFDLGIADEIIEEPLGGAHKNHLESAKRIKKSIKEQLNILIDQKPEERLALRYQKFRNIGFYSEN
ncbi:MAG: acetyl-CoA carboxylase carboxyltransferase subunit alpha [Bdellovibrionales bacterium]|nr:acetyl-CoA carboxylase carboxyltransferase subunit alpha [Bdellovibrionales bacterium]